MEYLLAILPALLVENNGETITCDSINSCTGAYVTCIQNGVCVVECYDKLSCNMAHITCIPGQVCVIKCASGSDVCRDVVIHAENAIALYVIGQSGVSYLENADIYCTNIGSCSVRCDGREVSGCSGITVHAQDSSSLTVEVRDGGVDILSHSNIYCPLTGTCNINIPNMADSDMLANTNIYAAQSFVDVNITCKAPLTYCNGATLYCTRSYNQPCLLLRHASKFSFWTCFGNSFCQNFSFVPTSNPTPETLQPTMQPIKTTTLFPSNVPTPKPTKSPTLQPINKPTSSPINFPTPTNNPSLRPTFFPSISPSYIPTHNPTNIPIHIYGPTGNPTVRPTKYPTHGPTIDPTLTPTQSTFQPSASPTNSPSFTPSNNPSAAPTFSPTYEPSNDPTDEPTYDPTPKPTHNPTQNTIHPTHSPTSSPTHSPSDSPTMFRFTNVKFDSFFMIRYLIKDLEHQYIQILVDNIVQITDHIIAIIDQAYFESTGLKARFFSIEFRNMLGFKIKDINHEKYTLFVAASNDEISIDSKIKCDKISCLVLLKSEFKREFEATAQTKLRAYFSGYNAYNNVNAAGEFSSQLIFEIASYGKLESANPTKQTDFIKNNKILMVLIVIMLLTFIISFLAFLHTKEMFCMIPGAIAMDNTLWFAPIIYGLQIVVILSDCNVFVDLILHDEFMSDIRITICGISCITFIIIPYAVNLYFGGKYLVVIPQQNMNAILFFKQHKFMVNVLIVICGGCFPVLFLLSSSIFGLQLFSSGLFNHELQQMNRIKIVATIFLQNIPQICIECVYAATMHNISPNIAFAIIISVSSILCTPFAFAMNTNRNHFTYYIQIKNDTFEANKGKTDKIAMIFSQIFGFPSENIEISRNSTVIDEGEIILYVTQFVSDDFVSTNEIRKLYMAKQKILQNRFKKCFDLNGECVITFKSVNGNMSEQELNYSSIKDTTTNQQNNGVIGGEQENKDKYNSESKQNIELQPIHSDNYNNSDAESSNDFSFTV